MRRPLMVMPVTRDLPAGCNLRSATHADATELAAVLTGCFPEDPWTAERIVKDLLDHPEVPLTFVVVRDHAIVGAASYMETAQPAVGWLHWVAVDAGARCIGLGEIVCGRVLLAGLERHRDCILLTTDDFRLPAIKTYLKLGFIPDAWHESHEARWQEVMRKLSITEAANGGG